MSFIKYMHIERLGTEATEGILDGQVWIYPKIDGTNASIWFQDDGDAGWRIASGSRNRELSIESDNAGFASWVFTRPNLIDFFDNHPSFYLYGEWLVPHSLKTYREGAWRDFYVFDVYDATQEQYLSYEAYKPLLEEFGINYIPPIAIIKNPDPDSIMKCLDKNGYLIEDGKGVGEGITIKNYGWANKFGQQIWAKVITNEFKEIHHKKMGAPEINNTSLDEDKIVEKYVTSDFIQKEKAKIVNSQKGYEIETAGQPVWVEPHWKSSMIPELLGRVYYELLREEAYNFVKEFKDPKINFKYLKQCVIRRVKSELGL